jgi:spermidine synthase
VVEASRYFREFTGDVLKDPRVNLIVADGRNHLALTDRRYDVIISEPSNPWVAGMGNLFTLEFFELAQQRLRPDGVMCQWVHAYSMSPDDFKTVVHTFQTVFPHVTLWEATIVGGDYLLIGSQREVHIDPRTLTGRLGDGRMKTHLERMHIRGPAALISKLIMTGEAIPGYIEGAPLHTDGNALLEYSTPRALLRGQSTRILEELYQFRSKPADMLRSLGWAEIDAQIKNDLPAMFQARKDVLAGFINYKKGAAQDAIERFERALALNPHDYDATYLLAELHYKIANLLRDAKRPAAETALAFEKSVEVIDNFTRGDRALLADHFRLDVFYAKANLYLGTLALKENRPEQAVGAFEKSISGEVRYSKAHNNLGIAYESTGRYDAAAAQYQLAIERNPSNVSAYMNMGNTRLKQKRYQEAIENYHQAEKLRPDFALTHYSLGIAYFRQKEWERAEKEWTRTLELKPDFPKAREMLNAVRKLKSI